VGVLVWPLAGAASTGAVALLAVDVTVWCRTRALRRGRAPMAIRERASRAPSPARTPLQREPAAGTQGRPDLLVTTGLATHLAWILGSLLALAGVTSPGGGKPLGAGFVLAGSFVALAGLWGRVTSIQVGPAGVLVRHAVRRPLFVGWTEGPISLSPPRAPAGGWRLRGGRGSRAVAFMPSDLLRNEAILGEIIRRAGLRWEGRAWVLPP
jgi:hypothetical protein